MEKVKDKSHVGFVGVRFLATRLCEKFCLVDTMPNDPEYRRKAAFGCVIYFQKILEERPYGRENGKELTEKARQLEKQWKEGPDYKRQIRERTRLNRKISAMSNKGRSHAYPVNCHPYEKPPVMRNFPKGHGKKKQKPEG